MRELAKICYKFLHSVSKCFLNSGGNADEGCW